MATATAVERERARCPGCNSVNISTEHLIREYFDLLHEALGGFFKHNARRALNEVVEMLHARGVTEAPNAFGPITIGRVDW